MYYLIIKIFTIAFINLYHIINNETRINGGGKITVKTCMVCKENISIYDHHSGLVFKDEHFVCEKCTSKHSNDEIKKLSKTIMQDPCEGMPIGLWLLHEQNKDKPMMTSKK